MYNKLWMYSDKARMLRHILQLRMCQPSTYSELRSKTVPVCNHAYFCSFSHANFSRLNISRVFVLKTPLNSNLCNSNNNFCDKILPHRTCVFTNRKHFSHRRPSPQINFNESIFSSKTNLEINNFLLSNSTALRGIHLSSFLLEKEESKVELSMKALKSEAVEPVTSTEDPKNLEKSHPSTQSVSKPTTQSETPQSVSPTKKTLMQRITHEFWHYFNGFKLLYYDVKVCFRLVRRLLNGKTLVRREQRQLVRTTSDLFRLVPFSVFIIVPFMEFLLPVAIKLFPAMLPSTFKEKDKELEKNKKKLKVKLEMAKFLQDTIEASALQREGSNGKQVKEFIEFMDRIRSSEIPSSSEEIVKYSKLFGDNLTLDNLDHSQLTAMCKVLEIPTFGTRNFLRFQLRMKLRKLEADDRLIQIEGIDSLDVGELQEACRARGMRALGVVESRLREQLQQWLDLNLNEQIPISLLLLSRTLHLPDNLAPEEQLKATISSLPSKIADEAKIKISEIEGDRVDNKTMLDVLKKEEAIIKEEKLEAKAAEEEIKESAVETTSVLDKNVEIVDTAPILTDNATTISEKEGQQKVSTIELGQIEDIIEKVAEKQLHIDVEEEELKELKEDVNEYSEDIKDLNQVSNATGVRMQESKGVQRLRRRVDGMISRLDNAVNSLHHEKEILMEDIEITEGKMKEGDNVDKDPEIQKSIFEKKQNLISVGELIQAMKDLQKVPDDTLLNRIAQVLDENQDGNVDLNMALKVIETLGHENVNLTTDQIAEIMEILRKEEVVEESEKPLPEMSSDNEAAKVKN